MVDPVSFNRRTPLRGAIPGPIEWTALDEAAAPLQVGHRRGVGDLAVADLSSLPRLGFKGRGTLPAMGKRGIVLEAEPNRAFRQGDGSLCLVLGHGEVMLLGAVDGALLAELEREWRIGDEEATYPVPRRDSHAWLAIAGRAAPDMLARLCAVDLRLHKFADLAVAQTSVARLNTVVVRADKAGCAFFHLLADSASSVYLLACILDASEEFGGGMVGLEALAQGSRKWSGPG